MHRFSTGSANKHGKRIGKCGKADLGVYCRAHNDVNQIIVMIGIVYLIDQIGY